MARESDDIRMSAEEVRAFLATQGAAALATLEPDGSLWCSMHPIELDGDELAVSVAPGSRAGRNLSRDPRVCAVIESASTSYYEIRSVIAHGVARPSGQEERRHLALDDVIAFDFGKIRARF